MKNSFSSDESPFEPINRLSQPAQAPLPDFEPPVPLVALEDLIPEDWLADFAADDPERREALDSFTSPEAAFDITGEEWKEDAAGEPPSLAEILYPTPPGTETAAFAAEDDSIFSGDYFAEEKARQADAEADLSSLDSLGNALGHINGAMRDILCATETWKNKTILSDLTADYLASLLDRCHTLDDVGEEVSLICQEVLARMKKGLPPDFLE